MDPCEVACATTSAPFLRNKVDIAHDHPRKKREKISTQNKQSVVGMFFEEIDLWGGVHDSDDSEYYGCRIEDDTGRCTKGVERSRSVRSVDSCDVCLSSDKGTRETPETEEGSVCCFARDS